MGDRCNFIISTKSTLGKSVEESVAGNLVLYSHWGGHQAGSDLQSALEAARPRWGDDSYCARIIVSQIIGGNWSRETGYGLTVGQIQDNEWPYLLVDIERGLVLCEDRELTFSEYVKLSQTEVLKWTGRSSEEDE